MYKEQIRNGDLVGAIMEFEGGDISAEDFLELFAALIRNGMAWTLQGFYGRSARDLIEQGLITRNGEITQKAKNILKKRSV